MKKHAGIRAGSGKTALFLFCYNSLHLVIKKYKEATTQSEVTISEVKK